MSAILTFVAADVDSQPLKDKHLKKAEKIAKPYGLEFTVKPVWLEESKAADVIVDTRPGPAILNDLRKELDQYKIDIFVSNPGNRIKKLLLADMDSTIVAEETLDELAAFAGLKDKVAEITARAMNGEIDFHGAIRERVALLKGLATQALEDTLAETIVNPGAKTLVATMKAHGATCVLVSGGFTFFTGAIAEKVGFDNHHGNTLGIEGGVLTGLVIEPILDKFAKVSFLEEYMKDLVLIEDDCMTIGDGANDIPMLKRAGLGVGYKPKPAVAQEVENIIVHGDLSAALYAQGYRAGDIVKQ